MTEQLEDLNAKVLDIETNINKGGIEADDLRHILTDAFNRVTETELLSFNLDADSLQRSFENNGQSDIEITDQEFDIQNQCEVILSDYELCIGSVNWDSVAEDVDLDADFDDEALTGLIDRIIDKVCPSSQDVPSQPMEDCNAN